MLLTGTHWGKIGKYLSSTEKSDNFYHTSFQFGKSSYREGKIKMRTNVLAIASVAGLSMSPVYAATFTDRASFDAALGALGTVSADIATYDGLTAGNVLPDGTAVSGITHAYTGGNTQIELFIRDFSDASTNTLGTLFDRSFVGAFGFDDAVRFTTVVSYRAVAFDLFSSPTFDFLASDVSFSAGGETMNVEAGAGLGTDVTTGVERRFFGIIAGGDTINEANLVFNAPGESIGDVDNVSFYSVTPEGPITPVPLPSALGLLAIGLFGLIGLRRRKTA